MARAGGRRHRRERPAAPRSPPANRHSPPSCAGSGPETSRHAALAGLDDEVRPGHEEHRRGDRGNGEATLEGIRHRQWSLPSSSGSLGVNRRSRDPSNVAEALAGKRKVDMRPLFRTFARTRCRSSNEPYKCGPRRNRPARQRRITWPSSPSSARRTSSAANGSEPIAARRSMSPTPRPARLSARRRMPARRDAARHRSRRQGVRDLGQDDGRRTRREAAQARRRTGEEQGGASGAPHHRAGQAAGRSARRSRHQRGLRHQWFAEEARRIYGDTIPSPGPTAASW